MSLEELSGVEVSPQLLSFELRFDSDFETDGIESGRIAHLLMDLLQHPHGTLLAKCGVEVVPEDILRLFRASHDVS